MFETDDELKTARENGLCYKLSKTTIYNLINAGYPEKAFSETYFPLDDKDTFTGGTDEEKNRFRDFLTIRKAEVSFTSKEDIDKKAHGDYHLYFQ